ncbi:hypothetical protein [Streptomyces chartreusis]|uniref:hypothetical protein n=1 Tax=Streptomyces chartreusis TaxID=1969 RepID=UPI002E818117|nr:hypothetical protein [Streptomyces chartreusis]WUB15458.1 hypothetical protein OG997_01585 [Streptomyces chartreusis]
MPGTSLPDDRYSRTEATRLLCAGVYQDATFRRRVLDELVGHMERPVAPALGVDVLPVLAHAVRVARRETRTALLMLAAWAGFVLSDFVMVWDSVSDRWGHDAEVGFGNVFTALYLGQENVSGGIPMPWSQLYALVTFAMWVAAAVGERGGDVKELGLPGTVARAADGLGRLAGLGSVLFLCFYWYLYLAGLVDGTAQTPYPALFPLVITLIGWQHQASHRKALCRWLSKWTFPTATQPGLPPGLPYDDLVPSIHREQQAPVTLYDLEKPFIGMGTCRKSWSFAMELRKLPEETRGQVPAQSSAANGAGAGLARRTTERLTASAALDMIEPQLIELRESAARTGRDRLRDLEIERFLYLPGGVGRDEEVEVGGVDDAAAFAATPQGRGQGGRPVYDPEQIAAQLDEAVDEGGEARRVFLRVRVGAWHEQLVVTVLVRVHTQGGMLVLEVEAYVLGPIRKEFRGVDALVERLPEKWPSAALRALRHAPAIGVSCAIGALGSVYREIASGWSDGDEPPDVPRVSLRAAAAQKDLSIFQETDAERYIKTIQERIAGGVRVALREHGYRTEEFEQHIYQVSGGGVFIKDMSGGAIATGSHGQASSRTSPAPGTGLPRQEGNLT